jgi:hypothetical protein
MCTSHRNIVNALRQTGPLVDFLDVSDCDGAFDLHTGRFEWNLPDPASLSLFEDDVATNFLLSAPVAANASPAASPPVPALCTSLG